MAKREFYVVVTTGEDGYFIGEVTQIKSCFNQGDTVAELIENMRETIQYCLEEFGICDRSEFVGVQTTLVRSDLFASSQREFYVVITKDESGTYCGVAPQLRDCFGKGRTKSELMKNMSDAIAISLKDDDLEDCSAFLEVRKVEV